jgi:hypothetical protein
MFILPVGYGGGGSQGNSIEDLMKLQEFMKKMNQEKEEEDKKKKEKEKKPPQYKGMSTLEAVLLMTLLSPIIGPWIHMLYKWGFNYLNGAN